MPLISVVIPAYNAEKTIKSTVESVLNQTFSDFELIVVNDGSKDHTLEILSQISDSRLRVVSQANSGLPKSRNRGMSEAQGEYWAFLDADDLWTPDKLELQLKALQDNPEAAVAYSWTDWIDESGNFLRPGSYITRNGNVYSQLLIVNFLENGSNPLIHKKAFQKVGGFDESLPAAQDKDMWLRLAAHYDFVAVSSPQILYRVSSNSMSMNVLQLEAASISVLNRAYKEVPENLNPLKAYSFGNLYKYLTYKSLEGVPSAKKSLMAARFLLKALTYDPSLGKTKAFWKAWMKIMAVVTLPSHVSRHLLKKGTKLYNTSTLLFHIRKELPDHLA